jgi:hypothetical protein
MREHSRKGAEAGALASPPILMADDFSSVAYQRRAAFRGAGFYRFTMSAENYEIDPGLITVKKGENLRLIITATDRDHGIKLSAFDVD